MSEAEPSKDQKSLARDEFLVRLMELTRLAITEGIVDPNQGTNFTLLQYTLTPDLLDKSTFNVNLEEVSKVGKAVVSIGIPNPLDAVEDMLLSPEELRAKELLGEIEVREAFRQLGDMGTDEN